MPPVPPPPDPPLVLLSYVLVHSNSRHNLPQFIEPLPTGLVLGLVGVDWSVVVVYIMGPKYTVQVVMLEEVALQLLSRHPRH